jgi:hypothetical protein
MVKVMAMDVPHKFLHAALFGVGCAGGLAKNFATLVEVLGGFAEVKQADEERAASAEAPVMPLLQAALMTGVDVAISMSESFTFACRRCLRRTTGSGLQQT